MINIKGGYEMFEIWCQEIFEDKPYNPNFPIDRDLGFQWRQYLFGNSSIPSLELSFKVSEDILDNDYFEGEGIPIVSNKIKGILEKEAPSFIEFFPVKILDNKKISNKFFIVKARNEIECFDWDNSEYNVRQLSNGLKRISSIRNLVLIEDKIKDQIIFKIAETNYFLVCVRKDLCQKILDSGAKGIEFRELSQVLR
jgi:hypothetical protein